MKRLLDTVFALLGLVAVSPVLLPVMLLVWLQDFHSPFYVAARVGRNKKLFRMVKLRSMRVGADKVGVDSTAGDDPRVTAVGRFIRRYKLDEVTQLWNVLWGHMSVVGPRPNVERETALYTQDELGLLRVRPGITDFASIVFADEGDILAGRPDPDIAYNQLIRPWKSRLGLFYIEHRSIVLDLRLIWLTVVGMVSRARALNGVCNLLTRLGADAALIEAAGRRRPLSPLPPPGSTEIVTSRAVS